MDARNIRVLRFIFARSYNISRRKKLFVRELRMEKNLGQCMRTRVTRQFYISYGCTCIRSRFILSVVLFFFFFIAKFDTRESK